MMQIANGEFKMNKLFEQKSFSGNFYVNMWTTMPIDAQKSENSTETAVLMKVNKQELNANKQQSQNLLGQVKISLNLIIKKRMNKSISSQVAQFQKSNNNLKPATQVFGGSQSEQGLSYSQQIPSTIFNNFQILLKLSKLKVLNLQSYTSFNFFARYKIYGTSEQVSSDIQWDNLEPDLHHRLNLPCSLDNIQKMISIDLQISIDANQNPNHYFIFIQKLKIPFILEVWNKSEKGEDQIIGIAKINMSSIPKTILLPDFTGVNPNWISSQQSQLLIICNENVSISDLVENRDKGLLFVTIAFGSPIQISKFDTNASQQSDQYLNTQQRSQMNINSFYANNSLKPPLIDRGQLSQNNLHLGQTIVSNNQLDRNKQNLSAQKNLSQNLNNTETINYKSEEKKIKESQLKYTIDVEDEEIRQHSLTIKPESQITETIRSMQKYQNQEINSLFEINLQEILLKVYQKILFQELNLKQLFIFGFKLLCVRGRRYLNQIVELLLFLILHQFILLQSPHNNIIDQLFDLFSLIKLISIFSLNRRTNEEEISFDPNNRMNLIEKFVEIMQHMSQNMPKIQQKLKKLILNSQSNSGIQNKEFFEFIQNLEIGIRQADILPIVKLFDSQKTGQFKLEYFSKSFNSFQKYESQIKQKYQIELQKFLNIIESCDLQLNDIDKELNRQSEFGLMRKEKFVGILKRFNIVGDNFYELVEQICEMLDVKNDGLLFVSTLNDYLQSIDVYGEIKKLCLNYNWLFDLFQQDYQKNILDQYQNKSSQNPIEEAKQLEKEQLIYLKNKIQPNDLVNFQNQNNSFWEAMMLISIVKGKKEAFTLEDITISGEELKTYISAIKYQSLSQQQNTKSKSNLQSTTKNDQYSTSLLSSNSKKQDIKINEQRKVHGIDTVQSLSQLGNSQMKKSYVQKKQEQDELQLITDLLNNPGISSNNASSSKKNKSSQKQNRQRGEFDDFEDDIPINDFYSNQNFKENQKNIQSKIKHRDEFSDDSFERQERLIKEEETDKLNQQKSQNKSNSSQQEQLPKPSQSQTIKKRKFKVVHLFTVNIHKITSLNLGKDFDMQNFQLYYSFGDQEQVQMGYFDYFNGQSKYEVNYQGEKAYKLSNEEDLENILIQENNGIQINFEINKPKQDISASYLNKHVSNKSEKIFATADLSQFVILDIIQSSKQQNQSHPFVVEQCINLINHENQQSIGKIQLSIIYKVKEDIEEIDQEQINKQNGRSKSNNKQIPKIDEECLLEKETKIKRLLPKQGYLNILINAACTLKQHEIEWKNYKIVLFCDMFHEDSYLKSIFKSLNSTASYNMTEEIIGIKENVQITINQDIINYFQDNSCQIQLRIYPLDDLTKRSNPVVIGETYLNLQDLLIKQEINEEFIAINRIDNSHDISSNINQTLDTPYPISSSKESVGFCGVHLTYSKDKEVHAQFENFPQILKSQKNESNKIIGNTQKDINKNNYHQIIVIFEDILNLIEYDSSLVSDKMCYFMTKINGNQIESQESFKINFLENKIKELNPDTYIQFLLDDNELQSNNPVNIEIIVRELNKQQSEERIIGHLSIDLEILRKEFFQNLLEKYSMKCIKSQCFTILKGRSNSDQSSEIQNQNSIEDSIMKIRCNLRLVLVKYETKGDYQICNQFLKQLILQNPSKNLNLSSTTEVLEQIRIYLRYSHQDFDTILNFLTFDKQTLFNLLKISSNQNIQNTSRLQFDHRDGQKCVLDQNECNQLIDDVNSYDKNENGIINFDSFKNILRKYNSSLREQATNEPNKLDKNMQMISIENVTSKFDYIQFLFEHHILQNIAQIQNTDDIYQLVLKIDHATNVGVLFNGVVPNTYIKCIQFDFTTSCVLRDSNPQFNHQFEIEFQQNKFKEYNQIQFMLYHRGYNSDYRDNMHKSIELGKATLDLSKMFFKNTKDSSKQESFKILISSAHHSARNQTESYLHVNVQLNLKNEKQKYKYEVSQQDDNISHLIQKSNNLNEQLDSNYQEYQQSQNRNNNIEEVEENYLENQDALDNFHKTLMELRQENQEEDDANENYDYQQRYQNSLQNSSNKEKDDEENNFQSTIPKNKQHEANLFEQKGYPQMNEYQNQNNFAQREKFISQKDDSDILLENAMNEIDQINKEFNQTQKPVNTFETKFSKNYQDSLSYKKEDLFEQEYTSDKLPFEDYKVQTTEAKIDTQNNYKQRFQTKNNDAYDYIEKNLKNNLQQVNEQKYDSDQNKFQEKQQIYQPKYQPIINSKEQNTPAQTNINNNDSKHNYYSQYSNYLDKTYNQSNENKNIDNNNKEEFEYTSSFNKYENLSNKLNNTYQRQDKNYDQQQDEFEDQDMDLYEKNDLFEKLKQTQNEMRQNEFEDKYEKVNDDKYETFKPRDNLSNNKQQSYQSSTKPPIKKSDSQNSLKKLEKKIIPQSMKDPAEIDRISNIMKQNFSKEKKYFDYTSDSDDD